jgi:hypothetical protein
VTILHFIEALARTVRRPRNSLIRRSQTFGDYSCNLGQLWAGICCVAVVVVGTEVDFRKEEVSCPLAALMPEQYTSSHEKTIDFWVYYCSAIDSALVL